MRFPSAARSDSGRVGWAIFAFADAKSNGFPWAFAWQAAQVFSVTGRSPAFLEATGSRITGSGMYSLPAPWQDSQPTPSRGG